MKKVAATMKKPAPIKATGWALVAKDDDLEGWNIAWIDLFPTRRAALGFADKANWPKPYRAVRATLSVDAD
jgi:hypothetical protein